MVYSSQQVFQPKSLPGVKVHLRRISLGRRVELENKLTEQRAELRRISAELVSMVQSEQTAEANRRRLDLNDAFESIINRDLKPAYLRLFVQQIDDLVIDGQSATVDILLSDGPADAVQEIYNLLDRQLYLGEAEAGESPSPTTSSAADGGRETSSTVQPVDGSATGAAVTAASTIQTM